MKSMYDYISENWNSNREIMQSRLISWRKGDSVTRVDHPSRLDRARSLGFKAKKGFVIVRARVTRGGRQRPQIRSGRRTKTSRRTKIVNLSYQAVAEQRAAKRYPNCEVLNSYFLAKDGKYDWYEIILVDKNSPEIKADERMKWIYSPKNRGRIYRGLTRASKSSRMQ